MSDFLDVLARDAERTIKEGYYTSAIECMHKPRSLKEAIRESNRSPIITEIKRASPTLGIIKESIDVERLALKMVNGGAVAISILTEPKHFMGSLNAFVMVRKRVELPLLMKDVILSRVQIDTASTLGGDVVLLIMALFDRGYGECTLGDMVEYAHSKGIEVLLEAHTEDEFSSCLDTKADLVGINNRDLKTFGVDINTTMRILQKVNPREKVVVSESGIKTPRDIHVLRTSGAQAFLVGTAIMTAEDIEGKVKELVMTR